MHNPRQSHLQTLKRFIWYIKGTLFHGLQLFSGQTDCLMSYSDVDQAGCPDTRCSTSGYCGFLVSNLVSWPAKHQQTVSKSSSEAEYKGVSDTLAELYWLRNLMMDLHCNIIKASLVYCDNISSIHLAINPVLK